MSSKSSAMAPSDSFTYSPSSRPPESSSKGFRYIILFLTMACLTSICSNMVAFNVTMLCSDNGNMTRVVTDKEAQNKNTMSLWAVSAGSILATAPFNWLYSRFGARWVFFGAGIISTVSTVLIPASSDLNFYTFIVVRFFQGVAFGANFAAIGMVCSRWAALTENGFFLSAMTIFSQVSVIITNPVSGFLCVSPLGWRSVYYFHAGAGPILFGLWIWLYTDYPESHKSVNDREKDIIMKGKDTDKRVLDGFLPYKAICTNKVVLVVWFNAFGDIISAIFLLTYFPTYLKDVLGYSLETASVLSMFPAISHVPAKLFFGWVFDKLQWISEVNKMRICNTVALMGSAILFIVVGFIPNSMAGWSVACTTLNYAFIGANCGGFYKCGSLVSRQYAHFVIANIQFLKCISLFVSPLMVYIFVSDQSSRDQWRIIYLIMAAFLIIGNALFMYYVTDQPADFTNITKQNSKESKSKSSSDSIENGTKSD
ncbi:unnamed protein product [Bursaphelenchus okinawaensis]|uniref:Major facilitator superfamily (MFS) profile domain-containing protein n=1 Tax=Bursaphelenchus okinawaensis TaxID=465554 RepID=A0A811JRS6_9BILA|nr:unnamed protein product [Bursaphelenchus okinawaensis]CAG9079535.1 unnamed protein product [Bursaphelenchus okinawaensis]